MAGLTGPDAVHRMQEIYLEPIRAELITERIQQVRDAGVTVAGSLSPQRTKEFAKTVVDAGVDMFVIRGTTVSAEHVSAQAEPLNLKEFIYELDVPVIVGGCATYQAALHLMRTGAAGVLVGFGGGAAHTTRTVLGVAVPMASAVADVAAARRDYMDESGGRYVHVIADGSIGRSGDIAKAVACGADAVMIGSPLARATDAPGKGYHWGAEAHHPELPRGERVQFEHGRHPRGDPVRSLPRRRRHDEPDRRAAAGDGDDRLHRAQGVPAHRGRRPVGEAHPAFSQVVSVVFAQCPGAKETRVSLTKGALRRLAGPRARQVYTASIGRQVAAHRQRPEYLRRLVAQYAVSDDLIGRDGRVPVRWWRYADNFGDLLSPWLIAKMTGRERGQVRPDAAALRRASVRSSASPARTPPCGGRARSAPRTPTAFAEGATYTAVRGPLSRIRLIKQGIDVPTGLRRPGPARPGVLLTPGREDPQVRHRRPLVRGALARGRSSART